MCKAVVEVPSGPMQPSSDKRPENCSPVFPPVNIPSSA